MTKNNADGGTARGLFITPGRVACGAVAVAYVLLARRVQVLERARKDAARRLRAVEAQVGAAGAAAAAGAQVAAAAADTVVLYGARLTVQDLLRQGEDAQRAFAAQ